MAVDLDDRVVDVDQHHPSRATREQLGTTGQSREEPRGHRVELPDMAEGELPQERAQRRRCVGPVEQPAHRAVPQQRHVIDRVRSCDIPQTSAVTFPPAFAPLSVGTVSRSPARSPSPASAASFITGTSPAADTRFGSSNVAPATGWVWQSRIYEMALP
jgi:hypothetical protein